jgi:hypothetical protein
MALTLVKKFLAFCGTRKFIAAFTTARHLSLSWGSSIRSMLPHPLSWRYVQMSFSHQRLSPVIFQHFFFKYCTWVCTKYHQQIDDLVMLLLLFSNQEYLLQTRYWIEESGKLHASAVLSPGKELPMPVDWIGFASWLDDWQRRKRLCKYK